MSTGISAEVMILLGGNNNSNGANSPGERGPIYRDKNSQDYLETIREIEGLKNSSSVKGNHKNIALNGSKRPMKRKLGAIMRNQNNNLETSSSVDENYSTFDS